MTDLHDKEKGKKIEIVTNEDGDVVGAYHPSKQITKLGALRAIKSELRDWGNDYEGEVTLETIERCQFWLTIGGEYDGYTWWVKPDKSKYDFDEIEDLGFGFIHYFNQL